MAPPPLPTAENTAHLNADQKRLLQLNQWQINGRMALNRDDDGMIATMIWQQHERSYTIDLFTPNGGESMRIEGNPERVILTNNDSETFTAATAEQLLLQHFGVEVPISAIVYWVRGIPAPGDGEQTLNSHGEMIALKQSGWQVTLPSYQESGTPSVSQRLPKQLFMEGDEGKVRIVIHRWSDLAFAPSR
ncbi:MAG: outer membrane lipoprotein LolB [Gammaproteobacteria bacterium]|nr:outer membrane lipoprotein LolB [Gammaproteobacteria bacterium]